MSFKKHAMLAASLMCLGVIYTGCDPTGTDTTFTNCANKTLKAGDDLACAIGNRHYYLYASVNYDPSKPTALIVDAHGATETAEQHAGIDTNFCSSMTVSGQEMCWPGKGSGWRLEADVPGNNFIVATPQGNNNLWSTSDEDFILSVVTEAKKVGNVDARKVYITGISNGGALTYWVGCPNTDVFAGMAPVAGGAECTSIAKPIPLILFDAEPDFAYAGAVSAKDTMISLNKCKKTDRWLTIDSTTTDTVCRDDPFSTSPKLVACSTIKPAIEPTVCTRSYDCNGGVEVVFCEVSPANEHGAGNEASDAHILYGNDSHLNLPSLAWRFFKRFQ